RARADSLGPGAGAPRYRRGSARAQRGWGRPRRGSTSPSCRCRERGPTSMRAAGCSRRLVGRLGARVLAVKRHAFQCVEGLPRDALRIDGPVLVALRVAAVRTLLRAGGHIGLRETRANLFELVAVL